VNAGPGMTRFYYQGQEFETSQENWDSAIAQHAASAAEDHKAVVAAGGLHILGTERHESRRIDNQLRGRAGRQGDPGASRFYLSLEDDLMRIFAKEWVSTLLQRLGMEEGVPIESGLISRRIEAAQKAVEAQNFESRKHVLEYDDVMNKQREAVYGLRRQLLENVEQKDLILEDYTAGTLSAILDANAPENVHPDQWDLKVLKTKLVEQFGLDPDAEGINMAELSRHELGDALFEKLKGKYETKEQILGEDGMRFHERMVMLSVLDGLWKDHLLAMDHLREGIGLRGYAQQDPLVAYKRESFDVFEAMMARFQEDTVRYLFLMQIVGPDGQAVTEVPRPKTLEGQQLTLNNGHGAPPEPEHEIPIPTRQHSTTIDQLEQEFERKKKRELEAARQAGGGVAEIAQRRTGEKVGRNDPCPCGSGKKYKKCHGAEG
jgi:preprotein translocase subunit SecA